MLAAEKKKKYTVEDYMLLEEGAPFQLINYDLVMSPSPVPLHQLVSARFINALFNFLEAKNDKGFLVSAPMDVKFDDGNVLQPDILYIEENRVNQLVKNYIDGAPNLVIEVLSPSTAYYDLRQKKDIYEKYGVQEYIVIDPLQEQTEVYILQEGEYQLKQKAQKTDILKSAFIKGFEVDMSKLFR